LSSAKSIYLNSLHHILQFAWHASVLQLTDIQYLCINYISDSIGTNHIYNNILDKINLIISLINIEIDGNNFFIQGLTQTK